MESAKEFTFIDVTNKVKECPNTNKYEYSKQWALGEKAWGFQWKIIQMGNGKHLRMWLKLCYEIGITGFCKKFSKISHSKDTVAYF